MIISSVHFVKFVSVMVYSHWLPSRQGPGPGPGRMGCMVLCTHFSGPETVSGGVFQLYFNGFKVSSPGS